MIKLPFTIFAKNLGIDLGTANTLICIEGEEEVIINEPSIVAIDGNTNKVSAVGSEAKMMLGRTPRNITTIRPMKDGVISDFEKVEKMIRYFIRKVTRKKSLFKPILVIGVPSGITEVEKRAVQESCIQAGAREIHLIEEPLVAAIGAEMPINEPAGNMVVDIGGGTTEIAIISLGDMVIDKSVRIGGDEIDEAIIFFMKKAHNLIIGERTAENIKINFLDVWQNSSKETYEIRGRDSVSGLPQNLFLTKQEAKESVENIIYQIITEIKNIFDQCPPELSSDIMDRGIILTGGGATLKGLRELISNQINIPVIIARDPLKCVVKGAAKYLQYLNEKNKKNLNKK